MQSSSEQALVGEERYVTTLITAAKETTLVNTQFHKQATIFFPNRIHQNVPSTAMRAVKMDLNLKT